MEDEQPTPEYHLACQEGCITASVLSGGRPCRVYAAVKQQSVGVAQSVKAWISGGDSEDEFVVHLRDDRLYHWTSTYAILEIDDEQVCSIRLDRDRPPCCYPPGDGRRDICFFGLEETDEKGYALPFHFRRVAGDKTNYGVIKIELHHVKPDPQSRGGPLAADEASMGTLGSHVLGTEGVEVARDQHGTFTFLNRRRVPFLTFEFRYRVDVARLAREGKLPPLYTGPAFLMPKGPSAPMDTITLSDSDDEDDFGPAPAQPRPRPALDKRSRKTKSTNLTEECLVLSSDEEEEEQCDSAAKRRRVREPSLVISDEEDAEGLSEAVGVDGEV